MSWSVRSLNEYDYEWLCAQLGEFVAETPDAWGFGDAPRHNFVWKFCVTHGETAIVVQRDGTPRGFMSWVHAPREDMYPDARVAIVEHWWVSPADRGTRAGYLLMREFHDIMKQRNVTHTIISLAKDTEIGDNTMCRLGYNLTKRLFVRRV